MKIRLEGMRFFAFHGYFEEERKAGNHFIVDLCVDISDEGVEGDDLQTTLDYGQLYDIVSVEMQTPRKLLETIASNVLQRIGEDHQEAILATIKVTKLNPPVAGNVASSSIELHQKY